MYTYCGFTPGFLLNHNPQPDNSCSVADVPGRLVSRTGSVWGKGTKFSQNPQGTTNALSAATPLDSNLHIRESSKSELKKYLSSCNLDKTSTLFESATVKIDYCNYGPTEKRLYLVSKVHANSESSQDSQPFLYISLDGSNVPTRYSCYGAKAIKITKEEILGLISGSQFPLKRFCEQLFSLDGIKPCQLLQIKLQEKLRSQKELLQIREVNNLHLTTTSDSGDSYEVLQGEYGIFNYSDSVKTIGLGPCHSLVLVNKKAQEMRMCHIDGQKDISSFLVRVSNTSKNWEVSIIGGQTGNSEHPIKDSLDQLKKQGIHDSQIKKDILGVNSSKSILFNNGEIYLLRSVSSSRSDQERTALALWTLYSTSLIKYEPNR